MPPLGAHALQADGQGVIGNWRSCRLPGYWRGLAFPHRIILALNASEIVSRGLQASVTLPCLLECDQAWDK